MQMMRQSILRPIPELEEAAVLLNAAAMALVAGQRQVASELIVKANMPEIMAYAKRAVGPLTAEVHRVIKRPKCLPTAERDPVRMPGLREQTTIFARDGWRCRFCGIKVICKSARSVITRTFAIEANWTSAEFQRHSALYALASSLDHVNPHGRGGKNEQKNYVTSCYCCQFGRGEWTIEEAELEDPRLRNPVVDEWDGLRRLVG